MHKVRAHTKLNSRVTPCTDSCLCYFIDRRNGVRKIIKGRNIASIIFERKVIRIGVNRNIPRASIRKIGVYIIKEWMKNMIC